MTTPTIPAEAKVHAWFDTLGNWGSWGYDDELGAMHLITDAKRRQEVAPPTATKGRPGRCSETLLWQREGTYPLRPAAPPGMLPPDAALTLAGPFTRWASSAWGCD